MMMTSGTPPRRPGSGSRRRRLFRWGALALLAAGVACAASYPIVSGKTELPRFCLAAAERALEGARAAKAARWAPQALMQAEAVMRAARSEIRRQEVRFVLLRDFGAARSGLLAAEEKAKVALAECTRQRDAAKARADSAIASASDQLSYASDFAEATNLGQYRHSVLQRAKVAFEEARILADREEYPRAVERARAAEANAAIVGNAAADAMSRFSDARLVRSWKRMADDTIRWSKLTGEDAIVVYKDEHRVSLYRSGRPVKSWRAELGYNSVRDKQHAGDAATPEGRYRITAKKGLGNTTYYKALLLNYPNEEDRAQFERKRRSGQLPRWARLGGLIELHGEGGKGKDWTKGCVALSNHDMDDLFPRVGVGTPVTIVGGDGDGGTYTELVRRHRAAAGNGTVSQ
jgi:lipoprotein-anchoring transpeptidase ErfK/SrfK